MTINITSLKAGNVELVNTSTAQNIPVAFVSHNATTGATVYTASKTWTYFDNATYEWRTAANEPVLDSAGNPAAVQVLGSLLCNIPTPADTTPPTVLLTSIDPTSITVAGEQTITLNLVVTDPA